MDLKGSEIVAEPDTAISREVELKLRTTPQGIERLLASPLLAAGIPGLASAQPLIAAYYDTPDLQLHKRGLSLRVRTEGNRFVQTVKSSGTAAGALDRLEWQTVVPDIHPRPDWMLDAAARAALGHLAADELGEVCRTRIDRETRVVGYPYDGDVAIVEVALDRGELEAGERSQPTAEIELELLKGSAQAIYALALDIHDIAPVHLEMRSKAERAYALFTGAPPAWRKAEKLKFAPEATVDDGISAVFEGCFRHWMANEPAVLESDQPDGVHQVRVAQRRMRSALGLFSGVLPTMQTRWLKQESQWVAASLGAARNWDVFLSEVLAPLEAERADDRALTALREQCEQARARNYELARETLQSPRYTTFVLNFARWLDDGSWRHTGSATRHEILGAPLTAFAASVLERRYRKIIKQGRGLAKAPAEKRHKLRINIKKMRYASEFFASLHGAKKTRAMIASLAQMQDTLGDLNDLAVTEHLLETIVYQAVGDPNHDDILKGVGLTIGWSTARARRAEPHLMDQWTQLAQCKPFWKRAGEKKR